MNRLFTSVLLAFILTCSLTTSLSGQVYFLNENFSTGSGSTPPSGWTNNTLVGSSFDVWRFDNPGGRTLNSPMSSPAAVFDSDNYSSGGGSEDVTLESPAFNTTGYAGVTLDFDHYFNSGFGGTAIAEVWDGTTWNQVYFNNSSSTTNPKHESINITSYAANKTGIKVRFRWQGNYSWWWIVDNVKVYYVVDVQPLAVTSPASLCGKSSDSIIVTVKNNSGFAVTNIPFTVVASGLFSSTSSTTIASMAANSTTTVALAGGNTLNGGTVTLKAYTALSGDNNTANDTLNYSYSVIGTPAAPTVTTGSNCGPGMVNLSATPANANDSIVWYATTNTQGAPLGIGKSFTTPFISATTTYYAAASRGSAGGGTSLTTTTAAGNGQQGAMWDVTPKKDLILDSMATSLSTTGSYVIRVYYKTGTFSGYQSNASAWTQLGSDYNVTVTSGSGLTQFDVTNLNMYKSQVYGMYITIISGPSTTLNYTTLGSFTTYSNSDMDIYCGNGIAGLFAGTFSPRAWNGTLFYRPLGCVSTPVAVDATIKPTASGTTLVPHSGSKGFFRTGNLVDPDINASPDVIKYDLLPPTGFANSAYSTTWTITSITATTTGGYTVPSSMYTSSNPGSSNGGFNLNTDTTFNDSTIDIAYVVKRFDNNCDTVIHRFVHIAPRPHCSFSFPNVCEGDKTTFNNYSVIQSGTMSYFWDFGNGNTSTDATPSEKLGAAGNYTVKLVITSDYGYMDSSTQTVTVYKVPTAEFEFSNACEGTAVQLYDKSSLPSGTANYTWEYGDGSPNGTAQNSSRLYNQPGIYPVNMTVEVNGCKSSKMRYVTQAPRAVPAFSYTPLTCDNKQVGFTNSSTAPAFGSVSYTWDFGDGSQASISNAMHTYNAFNTYNVVLYSNTNLGCTDSVMQSITLIESPVAGFTINGSSCSGDDIAFSNTTTVPTGTTVAYSWDFGDAYTSSNDNPTHKYAAPGTKTVKLVALSSNGCQGEKDMSVTVNLKPNADFVVKDVCAGDSTMFKNNSNIADNTALTYAWDLDESKSSTDENPIVTYSNPGAKNVKLVVTSANGCADTSVQVTNVNAVPVVDIIASSNLTQDGKFNFTTNANGAKYIWLFSDGGKDSAQSVQYQFVIDGLYTAKLIVISDKGCIGVNTTQVHVNRLGIKTVNGLEGAVKMYPNPGAGSFALEFEGIEVDQLTAISVLNNLGQKVADINLNNIANNKVAVDISGMAAGIYFVQVETAAGKASFKYNLVK